MHRAGRLFAGAFGGILWSVLGGIGAEMIRWLWIGGDILGTVLDLFIEGIVNIILHFI